MEGDVKALVDLRHAAYKNRGEIDRYVECAVDITGEKELTTRYVKGEPCDCVYETAWELIVENNSAYQSPPLWMIFPAVLVLIVIAFLIL